ncbi:TRMU [Lepeophtheirus salmonis]|uniref:tRNA-5-taurinomethyluridine 2-sulfurtransferase n=1 Tax=Lepeophtheirus salmonis TaxID=72036 RepID=A0A7R8CKF3_LEPSM|nr:TRMU [Lepeophtheirus salmonis]CAF2848733.1 TRMU [Lepeophtheirus salmonis]
MIRRVAVGISGGVDSAVSALLLKKRGYEVIGVYMKNWESSDEDDSICDGTRDAQTAQSVCERLKIPFKSVNFVKEYWNDVFLNMLEDYQSGLTPNPDVLYNLGVDAVATGHYARNSLGENLELVHRGKRAKLLKPIDRYKDQTIFLSQISQNSLKKAIFPVGSITKEVVKKIAFASGFEDLSKKKESMGICFIGKRRGWISKFYSSVCFLINLVKLLILKVKKSLVPTMESISGHLANVYGLEDSKIKYTYAERTYPKMNSSPVMEGIILVYLVIVFTTKEAHWIDRPPKNLCLNPMTLEYRSQNTHPLTPASIRVSNREKKCKLAVISAIRQRTITPGQYAAFYLGDECLGSAIIDKVGPSLYDIKCQEESCRITIKNINLILFPFL